MPYRFPLSKGVPRLLFVLLLLGAICLPPAARAAGTPSLVGMWQAAGTNGSATLEFTPDGFVLLRARGSMARGRYRVSGGSQRTMEVTLDFSPGGPQRWAVEFVGPDELRQEKLAPQSRLPARLDTEAVTFARAGLDLADTAITPPTDGKRVTSRTNPRVTLLALRTINDYERKKPGGKNLPPPVLLSQGRITKEQAVGKDKAGKVVGFWAEEWYVQFERTRMHTYHLVFHAMGARGTTVEIQPRHDMY